MKNSRKKAFTLIEMLVVMGIIAMLLGGVSMLRVMGTSQLSSSAQQAMISAFTEAKNLATSKHTRSRVIIYKGDDDFRKLRQIAVLYEEVDEDGNSKGWITTNETMLTNGAFFVPSASDFNSLCSIGGGYNTFDVVKSTFNAPTGISSIVGIDNLSIKAQAMFEGTGDWYSYEFAPEGFSENAGSWIIVAAGKIDAQGKLRIDNPNEQKGFVVRKFGQCIGFSDQLEMLNSNVEEKE